MTASRILLTAIVLTIGGYTAVVIGDHGLGLLPVFFGDILRMGWPGQVNLDVLCMLMLSGLWVAWRHGCKAGGLGLGLFALFRGAFFLSAYLLVVSLQARGAIVAIRRGPVRAAR